MLTRMVLTGLLASALVFAQRGGGGGARNNGAGASMPNMGFGGGTRLDMLSEQLKLSKDQKKDIKAAMDEAQKQALPLHEQMNKSRLTIAELIAGGKGREEIDKAIESEAELETQMASLELHTFAKMLETLEVDQKKQGGTTMLFALVRGAFMGKNWNSDQ